MRRRARQIADEPGQDSFLDIVANLVGILIILVMIVGLEFLFRAGKLFGLISEIKWGFLPIF